MTNDFRGFASHLQSKFNSANQNNVPSAVGIGWYEESSYDACLAVFDDADSMPTTHAKWLAKAEALEKQLNEQGMRVIRVPIEPDSFRKFCKENGFKRIDGPARSFYGNFQVTVQLQREQAQQAQNSE